MKNKYYFTVTVVCDTHDEARQVMAERLGYDEDYGFEYRVDFMDMNPKDELDDAELYNEYGELIEDDDIVKDHLIEVLVPFDDAEDDDDDYDDDDYEEEDDVPNSWDDFLYK